MSVHLTVHYLDLLRHDLAWAWVWTNWIGNIVAGIVVFLLMSLLWPRLRRAIEAFVKGHVKSIHDKLDLQHEERLRQAEVHQLATHKLLKKQHAEHMAALGVKSAPQPRNAKGHFQARDT